MEQLQSQAPDERELLGSSVVKTLEFGNWIFDLRMWTLETLKLFYASFDSSDPLCP